MGGLINAMAGPTDANATLNAAALVNERKEEPQNGVEDWRIMEASFNRYLLARVISRAPENGRGSLQKNFNAGELRYVRNIPGGRRQRAPPDGAAVVISN